MSTVFVLGPSLDNVIEPEPAPPPAPGRRGVEFRTPPTQPGGVARLRLLPGDPADAAPLNVYAFWVNPPSSVPSGDEKTPEWFFKSGSPSGSAATDHMPEEFDIATPGVLPGVYVVQIVLEYRVA